MEKTCGRSAGIQQINDLLPDCRRVAAKNRRAACLQQIVILIAVDIRQLIAGCTRDHDRERVIESEVVLHATRNYLLCFLDHRLGFQAFF